MRLSIRYLRHTIRYLLLTICYLLLTICYLLLLSLCRNEYGGEMVSFPTEQVEHELNVARSLA